MRNVTGIDGGAWQNVATRGRLRQRAPQERSRRYRDDVRRIWFAALIALSSCTTLMVRAPKQIPADGTVECTDSMDLPIAAAVASVVATSVTVGVLVDADRKVAAMESVDLLLPLWLPLVGSSSVTFLIAAVEGRSYALECRAAKRRGAEQAALVQRKEAQAKSRAEASALWKRAAAAARADDCVTVRELDPKVRALDVEFHAVVFARDVAIARCLL